jgi:large-conductance mechanosensitive channel
MATSTGRNPGNPARKRRKPATQTHVITTSAGNVRITEPANFGTKKGKSGITVLVGEQAQQLNPVSGFVGFLRERAVVGVAIAFVVASQMQIFAKDLVDKLITPTFTLLFGWQELSAQKFTLHWHDRASTFYWGSVTYAFINFLFIVAAIYVIIRFLKLDKLDKKKD